MQAVNIRQSCDLSRSALDREHRLDLVGLAAVDGRLAAFVVKRMDDHFEFSVSIQIKDCSEIVYTRRNRLSRFRLNFTSARVLFEQELKTERPLAAHVGSTVRSSLCCFNASDNGGDQPRCP